MKVDDLEDLALQPLLVLILVLHEAVIELLLDVGEDVEQFFEVVFADHTDRGVVLCLDGGGALGFGQKSDFTEVLARLEHSNKTLLSFFVFDPTLALAFRDDEEVVSCFTLLNLYFLRLAHDKLNLRYHVVFDL